MLRGHLVQHYSNLLPCSAPGFKFFYMVSNLNAARKCSVTYIFKKIFLVFRVIFPILNCEQSYGRILNDLITFLKNLIF